MTIAAYSTDLVDINLGSGLWVELTGATAGRTIVEETDYFIEGTNCMSEQVSATGLASMGTDAGAISIAADDAVFIWLYWSCPNTLATLANGGHRVAIGSSVSDYKMWSVLGSDTYIYGGWQCHAIDPLIAADFTYGSPTAVTQIFGSVVNNLDAVKKGNPFGVDAIRHGKTIQVINGDVTAYGTFVGAALENDYNDATNGYHRWGLFQAVTGGYLSKGLFLMGTAATAVDFRDENRNIAIQNTTKVSANFNTFEVRNASSRVDWTNIQITAQGTVSPGRFLTTDNADVNFDTCTFNSIGTFLFMSQATVLSTTFRKCGLVTQGGGTFTECRFEDSSGSSSILVDNPNLITKSAFISDGSNHAMELTSGCAGNSYTLSGHSFIDYATVDGSTGNEVIYNNSGGAVTLNVSGCTGTVTVRNGTGSTTTVVSNIILTLTGLEDGSDIVIVNAGTETELLNVDSNSGTTYDFSFGTGGISVDIGLFKIGYVPYYIRGYTLPLVNSSLPAAQVADRNYNNPV